MKRFSLVFLLGLLVLLGFSGCDRKPTGAVAQMHWDRDMCERCKMAISERKFAAQVINPRTGKVYKFDDLGCAVLWLDEEKIPWREKAVIWITDAKTGEWIDARKALYVDGAITPMAYGLAAYSRKTLPQGAHPVDFQKAVQKIREVEAENSKKVGTYR